MQPSAEFPRPRQMLRRLRDVMAAPQPAQARLDQVVKIIAGEMVSEVCSVYLRRGEMLELFATEGLRPEAVHRTRLRIGEGLVGDIAAHARAAALSDAQSHPKFAYRPETGEEIYHSLMGVPILRAGRVLGVLVVQNRTRRQYQEEEVENLETIAMVLAELVATGELAPPNRAAEGRAALPLRLPGLRLNGGLASGEAVIHERRLVIRQVVAENPAEEQRRLREAMAEMHLALDALVDQAAPAGESRDVMEAYRMVARDRGWLQRITEAIRSGLTAEAAVHKVQNDTRARMQAVTDPYLREKLLDFEDLANRLLHHLTGGAAAPAEPLPAAFVLCARSMGPAELLDYSGPGLKALVLEEGSATAHVAIVARALDIPVVARVAGALTGVEPGDPLIVDGNQGVVFVRPTEAVLGEFRRNLMDFEERRRRYAALRDLPAETLDGEEVTLLLNAGLTADFAHLAESGAAGVGLYRTEIAFMVRGSYPDTGVQEAIYARVLDLAAGRPVVFRTLDAGADKKLPYFHYEDDENPAMGWRSLRIALDRPFLLRQQLRAMIRAAAGRDLLVMFPMVTEVAEFRAARGILERELAAAACPPRSVSCGAMLEVPALLWQLPELLRHADFLSVGSNDLLQFVFAADRGSRRLMDRYDPLSTPVLRLLADVARQCAAAGRPLTVCGEMAGRPLEALALIGIGIRRLSMTATAIGPVKAMVRQTRLRPLAGLLADLLAGGSRVVRGDLSAFARDHGITV
ncbi:MAG: phosphoenolpyruvate--protein phosphotransferase [Thalassobaculales bacterium]